VSGYPENSKRGLPYIAGLLVLNDAETGMPLAVMDCTWITAQRTGAATAVAAKYLARKESATVGMLGCGVQGRSDLEALNVLFPIKKVRAYDVHPERCAKYAQEMSSALGIEGVAVASARDAVVVLRYCGHRRPHLTETARNHSARLAR
jgi:ornithine cyclodeaminase/alanine dehydrogenase-like protein (mu-crystallin family)